MEEGIGAKDGEHESQQYANDYCGYFHGASTVNSSSIQFLQTDGSRWWRISFLFPLRQHAFDAAVGDEPNEGDEDEEGVGNPGAHEGEGDGGEINDRGDFAFAVFADGGGEEGGGA